MPEMNSNITFLVRNKESATEHLKTRTDLWDFRFSWCRNPEEKHRYRTDLLSNRSSPVYELTYKISIICIILYSPSLKLKCIRNEKTVPLSLVLLRMCCFGCWVQSTV
jgi:hypothetical protein